MQLADPSPEGLEFLLAARKQAIRARGEMLALQKECQHVGDLEGARFFREEAAHHLMRYRATTFLLPWFDNDPPGDSRGVVRPSLWPGELALATGTLNAQVQCLPLMS